MCYYFQAMEIEGGKITIAVEVGTTKIAGAAAAEASQAAMPILAGETDEIQTDDLPLLKNSESPQLVHIA